MNPAVTRRTFLKTTTAASALAFPAVMRSQAPGTPGPNNRLNVAIIGVGGRGGAAVTDMRNENVVALCDVDEERADGSLKNFAGRFPAEAEKYGAARRFTDYRKMFDELGNKIDAVTISVPDHSHFAIAMTAMKLGKHVYVEKPLSHTVWEARELTRVAREKKVVTQMGNQGHTHDGTRVLKEWVQAGVLGEVREIVSWTNRPFFPLWREPVGAYKKPDHSKFVPVVPKTLNWDAWLGASAARPYDPAYLPGLKWRGWWDFGTGAIGDMGCHLLNLGALVFDLSAPSAVEAWSEGTTSESAPKSSHIVWDFPARAGQPALKFHWYDGGKLPPADLFPGAKYDGNGVLVVGANDTMLTSYEGGARFKSGRTYDDFKSAPELFPKMSNWDRCHYEEWITACKGGPKAYSNFDTAGPVSEAVLLGNVAIRAGQRIEWDAKRLRVTNAPVANQFIRTTYRPGWV